MSESSGEGKPVAVALNAGAMLTLLDGPAVKVDALLNEVKYGCCATLLRVERCDEVSHKSV